MTTLTAKQLIYTNVEADRSPTKQRGFQVWLADGSLTADQKRLVARRVDDFRIPAGTPAGAAVVRYVFCRPFAGILMVGRTVPLAGVDKFGRGGKFHSHVLLFEEEAFERSGGDPFRVFDGGFRFHETPDDFAGDWQAGLIPAADVPLADGTDTAAVPADKLQPLAAHFGRDDGRTVVVLGDSAAVLAAARAMLKPLPPALRVRAGFDTLSTGASLGQIRYPLAGCPTAAVLKTWAFRKTHTLDAASWACTPPLDKAAAVLPGGVIAAAGWAELGDDDKNALFRAADAVATNAANVADVVQGLSPAAGAVFGAIPEAAAVVETALAARIAADVPPAVAGFPAVKAAVAAAVPEAYPERIAAAFRPISRESVAAGVLAELTAPGVGKPPGGVLAAALGLADVEPRLQLVVRRWNNHAADHDAIRNLTGPELEWFAAWARTTLPADLHGEDGFTAAAKRFAISKPVTAADVANLNLALAVAQAENFVVDPQIDFLAAFHGGGDRLDRLVRDHPDMLPNGPDLLAGGGGFVKVAGWACPTVGVFRVGVWFVPTTDGGGRVLYHVATTVGNPKEIVRAVCPRAFPARTPENQHAEPPEYGGIGEKWFGGLHDVANRRVYTRTLAQWLVEKGDTPYREFFGKVSEGASGVPVVDIDPSNVLFAGLEVKLYAGSPTAEGLELALAAATPRLVPEELTADDARRPPSHERRFWWVMARLAAPATTTLLRI